MSECPTLLPLRMVHSRSHFSCKPFMGGSDIFNLKTHTIAWKWIFEKNTFWQCLRIMWKKRGQKSHETVLLLNFSPYSSFLLLLLAPAWSPLLLFVPHPSSNFLLIFVLLFLTSAPYSCSLLLLPALYSKSLLLLLTLSPYSCSLTLLLFWLLSQPAKTGWQ